MYTEKELVSFGNYLLSEERKNNMRTKPINEVWHSDLENWKEKPKTTVAVGRSEHFKHKAKVLTKEEIEANRSNAYKYWIASAIFGLGYILADIYFM